MSSIVSSCRCARSSALRICSANVYACCVSILFVCSLSRFDSSSCCNIFCIAVNILLCSTISMETDDGEEEERRDDVEDAEGEKGTRWFGEGDGDEDGAGDGDDDKGAGREGS